MPTYRNGRHALLVAALSCSFPISAAAAQSASPDSAGLYLARARGLDSSNLTKSKASAFPLWLRAAELFRARADTLSEAESLFGAARARGAMGGELTKMRLEMVPLFRKASALFLSQNARKRAADVLWEIPIDPVWTVGFTLDTAVNITLEAITLRRELGDRGGESVLLSQLSGLTASADSAVMFAQRARELARAAADTAAELAALAQLGSRNIGRSRDPKATALLRRARHDSAATYLRETAKLARLSGNIPEEFTAFYNLVSLFDPNAGIGRTEPDTSHFRADRDSTFHYAVQSLNVARRVADGSRELIALARLSDRQWTYGDADSARYYTRLGVALATMRSDTATIVSLLYAAAGNEDRRGSSDSALVRLREAASVQQSPAMRSRLSQTLLATANIYQARSQTDSARVYFDLLAAHAAVTGNAADASKAGIGIGRIFLALGELDSAIVHFAEVARSKSDVAKADGLDWLAVAEGRSGQLDSAISHGRQSVELYQRLGNRMAEANALEVLGSNQAGVSDYRSADISYRAALSIFEAAKDRRSELSVILHQADAFRDSEQLDSAFVVDRRALKMASSMNDKRSLAQVLVALGRDFTMVAQRDSGRAYMERAASLFRESGYVTGEANALFLLAWLMPSNRTDTSLALIRRAQSLRARFRDARIRSQEAFSLATIFLDAHRADSALVYAREALRFAQALRDPSLEAKALAATGFVFAELGHMDSTLIYVQRAINILPLRADEQLVREYLAHLADLYRSGAGGFDLQRSTAYYDSAATLVDFARRRSGSDGNEVSLAEYEDDVFSNWARAWTGRRGQVGAPRSAASALGAVERGRAQSLVEMLHRSSLTGSPSGTKGSRDVGSDLALEVDSMLASLRASHTAALTYLMAGDTLFTWLLTPTGSLEMQIPVAITEAEINRLVRSSRRTFMADDARAVRLDPDELTSSPDSTLARSNAERDWKQLASLLLPADFTAKVPFGTPIVIVPHGSIGLVPFSALATDGGITVRKRTSTSSRRATTAKERVIALGARNPLRFAPSFAALRASEARPRIAVTPALRSLAAQRAWRATRASGATSTHSSDIATTVATAALVVGNPSMPYIYSGRWSNRAQLQPLPGAEAEAHTIAKQLGGHAITGKAATETAIRAQMSTAPLIHFATHGLAYGADASARRSFVAFAPDSTHDGLLTMGEMMDDSSLTLRAELVVLSACQTGLGNMKRAEGSVGLQRAFLAKGARSVLVSLWNVDDTATRLLMEKFYAFWLDPTTLRSKASALQMAQDAVRRTPGYENPKYWAAFQLVGAN